MFKRNFSGSIGRARQGGWTLAELSTVILAITVLSSLVFGGGYIYVQKQQGTVGGQALSRAGANLKFRMAPDYTLVSLPYAVSTGEFDNVNVYTIPSTRDAITHRMGGGGTITVAPASSNTVAAFTIPNVPLFACENFVNAVDANADSIVVGSTTVKASGATKANLNLIACSFTAGTSMTVNFK